MAIVVHEDNTGYAPKHCRFYAIDDDTYDWAPDHRKASSIGYGASPAEAIADLLEIMLDEGEITEDEFRDAMRIHGTERYLDPDRLREDRDDRLEALR
jgi:hypothetical protein